MLQEVERDETMLVQARRNLEVSKSEYSSGTDLVKAYQDSYQKKRSEWDKEREFLDMSKDEGSRFLSLPRYDYAARASGATLFSEPSRRTV